MKGVVGMAVRTCRDAPSTVGPGGGPEMITLLGIDPPPLHSIYVSLWAIGDGSHGTDTGTFLTMVAKVEGGSVR
jgi:hypothetical protein